MVSPALIKTYRTKSITLFELCSNTWFFPSCSTGTRNMIYEKQGIGQCQMRMVNQNKNNKSVGKNTSIGTPRQFPKEKQLSGFCDFCRNSFNASLSCYSGANPIRKTPHNITSNLTPPWKLSCPRSCQGPWCHPTRHQCQLPVDWRGALRGRNGAGCDARCLSASRSGR